MSTPQVGVGAAPADQSLSLESQILDEIVEDVTPPGQDGLNAEGTPTPSPSSDAKEDGEGEVKSEGEESSDEGTPSEEKAPKPEEEPKPEEKTPPLRIGNREFATAADALQEATRIMGQNGNLAGELNQTKTQLTVLKEQLDKAAEINAQWVEWAKKVHNGEQVAPPTAQQPDVRKVVQEALAEQRAQAELAQQQAQIKAEFDEVTATPNYARVEGLIYKLADKINPVTDQPFTPKEAYEYACNHLGETSAFKAKPVAQAPAKPIAKPAQPKVGVRTSIPTGTRGPVKTVPRPSEEDDYIDRSLSAGVALPY